ncbi:MAG: hypothetical protein R6W68_15215 [Ignavibacteriaceae bacterium]
MKSIISGLSQFIYIILFAFIITGTELNAQSVFSINDDIGGGGGTGTTQVDNSDDSMLYIVGGVVIVGIIVYALMKDKKENKTEDDSTKVGFKQSDSFNSLNYPAQMSLNNSVDLPVDFYIGMQRQNYLLNEKKYVVGVRFKL